MLINPFDESLFFTPNMEDFKMPYKLTTPTDKALMIRRYQGLNNYSHGCIVRLNYDAKISL